MKNLIYLFSLFLFLFSLNSYAQVYSENDVEICKTKFQFAVEQNLTVKPINDVITEIGKKFIGTPYVAHTLEVTENEDLIINLSGLDCTTFLENVIVFSRLIKKEKSNFEDFKSELEFVRYRDGEMSDYTSRLHYFSDWIYDNIKKNIVEDVTEKIGGEKIKFNLFFMSKNPDLYKHLKNNPEFVKTIKKHEILINQREYYFIPKGNVYRIENEIKNGDLIAITTNLKGLDISHVGIAVKMKNGRIHFMHAPLVGKEVEITEEPIGNYLAKIKKHTGIIVLRVKEPN